MKRTLTLKRESLSELTTDELARVAAAGDSIHCIVQDLLQEVRQTFSLNCWTFNCTTQDAS